MSSLPHLGISPALSLALRFQARARLRRLGQSFTTPRRIVLSLVAVVLAGIWLGNVILSLLFREPYGPEGLERWARVGLTVYTLWHLIRTAWERPAENLEWTPAEEQFLVSGPFTRRQLVQYRLMVVAMSAVLKATVATLLLLPDLTVPWLGLVGLCLALYLVELLRIGLDTLTAGLTQREYLVYRVVVLAATACAAAWMMRDAANRWAHRTDSHLPAIVDLIAVCIQAVQGFAATSGFVAVSAMFQPFIELLTTPSITGQQMLRLLLPIGCTWLAMEGVLRLDATTQRRRLCSEATNLDLARRTCSEPTAAVAGRLPRVVLGPIAWRQFQGMRLHLTGVLLALVAPALLSFVPFVLLRQDANTAFTNFVASLGFYTLLLLPPALKFDFRRDYDRLLALKMLPASPWRITLGQIAVPVLVATTFQWTLVLAAYVARPVAPGWAIAALCLFVPANLAIFGLDNLLFLLFPHRLQQEGLDVFLRTTLVFTAKGVIFAGMLAGVLVWSVAARAVADSLLALGLPWCKPIVIFGVGLWGLLALTAGSAIGLTASAFRHYDPSRGMVA